MADWDNYLIISNNILSEAYIYIHKDTFKSNGADFRIRTHCPTPHRPSYRISPHTRFSDSGSPPFPRHSVFGRGGRKSGVGFRPAGAGGRAAGLASAPNRVAEQ